MIKRLEPIIFVLSACFIAFVYGVVTVEYQIFPYSVMKEVKRGLSAWNKLESPRFPPPYDEEVKDRNVIENPVFLSDQAGPEFLLITGGFHENLDICPKFGCLARIIDRRGRVVHTWSANPADFVADIHHLTGEVNDVNVYANGIAMDDQGNLIVVFQGRNTFPYEVGIAKFAPSGKLLWKRYDNSHHWPTIGPGGEIYVPTARQIPATAYVTGTGVKTTCTDTVDSQGVRILSPDGAEKAVFWFDDILAAGGRPGLQATVADACNPYHVNGIAVVTEAAAKHLKGARPGDLAVSLRSLSSVAIIDRETGVLRDIVSQYFTMQHSPNFLPDGSLMVFDNQGGDDDKGGSRIVAVQNLEAQSRTIFPPADYSGPLVPFQSVTHGVTSVSPDGKRVLISEARNHRIIEVDAETGRPLWAMHHVINMTPFMQERGIEFTTGHTFFTVQGAYYVPPDHPILKDLK
jgi:hypothetical protein